MEWRQANNIIVPLELKLMVTFHFIIASLMVMFTDTCGSGVGVVYGYGSGTSACDQLVGIYVYRFTANVDNFSL